MITSHFTIAWRNILRNKIYSSINLLGLAVGICCFLLLFLFIRDELSYDRYHTNADRVYRLNRTFLSADGTPSLQLGTVAPPYGPLIREEFPQIKEAVRLFGTSALVRRGEKIFREENIFAAEENLFRVFDFNIKGGRPDQVLAEPYSVILSRPMAEKYFGQDDPVGQVLRIDNQVDYKVTGVFEPLPTQSSFHPQFIASFSTLRDDRMYGAERLRTDWGNNSFFLFLLLEPGADPVAIEKAFPAFQDKHIGPNTSSWSVLSLTPLTDIHLHSHLDSEMEANSDIRYVYYFSAIALFILLIACINYMNLTTARASKRAREIGLKKVMGVSKARLVKQFISESFLFTVFALLLGLLLAWLLLPYLNRFAGKSLALSALLSPVNLLWLVAFLLFVTLLSGSYPAFYLTSFQPVSILKGRLSMGLKSGRVRQALVVVQFSIAVLLIGCTTVVYRQLQYMQNVDLGYSKDQVVVFRSGQTESGFEAIRNDLLNDSHVLEVGRSSRIPTGKLLDSWDAKVKRGDSLVPASVTLKMLTVDERFIPAYQIEMAAGRNFSNEFATDSASGFIINETAAGMLGWKNPAEAPGHNFVYGSISGTIIGVSKDYHFESLHQRIPPVVMLMGGGGVRWVSVRIKGNRVPATLEYIQRIWDRHYPDQPFAYDFLDSRYAALYTLEQTQQTLMGGFSLIAILISCLGLLGLSMYMTALRVKEIGIRKVLGASSTHIVGLLSTSYLRLVLIAIVLAVPITWMVMTRWLQDFAYRIEIRWYLFAFAGLLAILIALATVGWQAVKAAMANPVESLRTE